VRRNQKAPYKLSSHPLLVEKGRYNSNDQPERRLPEEVQIARVDGIPLKMQAAASEHCDSLLVPPEHDDLSQRACQSPS
jgi:hypothetical protein